MVTLTDGLPEIIFQPIGQKNFMIKIFSPVKMECMECIELSETDNFTAQSHFVSCGLDSSG